MSFVVRDQAGCNWLDVSPAADTTYTAKLSDGPSGTWLVTDMLGRFANGSGHALKSTVVLTRLIG